MDKLNIFFNTGYSDEKWSVGPYFRSAVSRSTGYGTENEDNILRLGNVTGYDTSHTKIRHSGEFANFKTNSINYLDRYTNTVSIANRLGSVFSSEAVWTNVVNDHKDSADTKYDMISCIMNFNRENRYRLFVEYGTDRTMFYQKVRTYFKVEEGTGDYIFIDGEYYPDDFGNYSYYVSQSDYPSNVTGVRFDLRSYFDFTDLEADDNILYWLSRIDIEQDISIAERSRSGNTADIMLLNLTSFQNDSTVSGTIGSKTTLYYLKRGKRSADYYFHYKKDLFREYVNFSENTLLREQYFSLRAIEGVFTHRISGRLSFWQRYGISDNLLDDISKKYALYSIKHNIKPDLNYSIELEYGKENEDVRNIETDSYRINAGFSAGFYTKGIFRSGLDIIKVESEDKIPYSMNSGYGKGMSYKWSANADYSFSRNIFGNLIYTGRLLSYDARSFHELKLEIRMEL
jgi:hypothetical protein